MANLKLKQKQHIRDQLWQLQVATADVVIKSTS